MYLHIKKQRETHQLNKRCLQEIDEFLNEKTHRESSGESVLPENFTLQCEWIKRTSGSPCLGRATLSGHAEAWVGGEISFFPLGNSCP